MSRQNFAQVPAKPDAAGRLFQRMADEADAYAKKIGADHTTALNHQIGALHGHLRGLMGELATFKGTSAKPQMGCGLTTVQLGDADVLVEFEYEPGERAVYDVDSPACGPGCDPSLTIIQMLVNGVWIDPEDAVSEQQIERWQQQILDGETQSLRDMKDAADEARWEARQEALAERGYP